MSKTVNLASRSLLVNAIYILGVNIVPAGMGFAFWGLASRFYLPADIGLASAVISAGTLVSGIAVLGTHTGLIRFLPESACPERFLNTVYSWVALAAILLACVFLAGLPIWAPALAVLREKRIYLLGFLILVTSVALSTLVKATFVAQRQSKYALIYTFLTNSIRLPLVIWGVGLGAPGLVAPIMLAFLLTLLISVLVLLPKVMPGYRPRLDLRQSDLADLLPYSIGNFVADLSLQMNQTILPLLVLNILGPSASGHAYIAIMLGGMLTAPSAALGRSTFAEGAHLPGRTNDLLSQAVGIGLFVTVLLASVAGGAAPWVLMPFGHEYSVEASGLFRWLAAGAPFTVLNQFIFTRLRLQKRIGQLVLASATLTILSLGITAALLPRISISGVGVGSLVGNGVVSMWSIGEMRTNASIGNENRG
jgi:O-antigen/teichoic acid export membrane protein